MSYFPILKAPGATGWTTVCNFPPNNWEVSQRGEQWLNVTWSSDGFWWTQPLCKLSYGEMRTVTAQELVATVPSDALALLSLSRTPPPHRSTSLPKLSTSVTSTPAWRATLGLATPNAKTCYQGELDPFPSSGTLLTFGPFLQIGQGLENHLIILNIENVPVSRTAELEIYDASGLNLRGRFTVFNNQANVISMNGLNFGPEDLPLIVCKGMSAIPLYFSRTEDGEFLSLEHTHPPASLVVHGKRWEAQKFLKNLWFNKVHT